MCSQRPDAASPSLRMPLSLPCTTSPLCAGLAHKAGLSENDALLAITLNPARHLGVDDRVGTLEEGKDADLVITDGSPLSMETKVHAVYIDGIKIER